MALGFKLPSRRSVVPGLEWGLVVFAGCGGVCWGCWGFCGLGGGLWGFGLFAVGDEVEAVNGEGEFAALFAGFFVVPLVHFEGAFKDDGLAFGEVSGNGFGWFSEGGAFQKEGFFPFFSAGGFVFPAVCDAEVDHAFFVCEELGDGIAGEIPGDDEVVEGDAHGVLSCG